MLCVSSTPSSAELEALRAGRFVPLFGLGSSDAEGERALSSLRAVFAPGADPQAPSCAAVLLHHPSLGLRTYERLASEITGGRASAWCAPLALGATLLLGADDRLRREIADALAATPRLRAHCELSAVAGGGHAGDWLEHYQRLCLAARRSAESDRTVIRAMRAWYEWVLARRWSALDQLRATRGSLPVLGQWLVDSARWLAGDDDAREALIGCAETVLAPLARAIPGLSAAFARELAALLARPYATRWSHLRCAAARDHASLAIRHWLHAAAESLPDPEESPERDLQQLGPEPTRAGRAVAESRGRGDDFLLDWFVPDREAGRATDAWAADAIRAWHRLHGAALLGRALEFRETAPVGPSEVLP